MTNTIYRVRVVFKKKGIERSLPYEITSMELAEQTAETLNLLLEDEGCHHYAMPDNGTPVTPNQGKLRKNGRQVRV